MLPDTPGSDGGYAFLTRSGEGVPSGSTLTCRHAVRTVDRSVTGYRWVEALEAYCFTAIVGIDVDETIRRLGGDPSAGDRRTFDECFWAAAGPQWVQIGRVAGGVLLAEHNGWRAEEAVNELSTGARLACFVRDVNAVMRFILADDGRVTADFDPLVDRPPTSLGPAADGLPFGLFAAEPSALTLLHRVTGVRITPAWLNRSRRAVPLPPLTALV
jgi:hypothetical protein